MVCGATGFIGRNLVERLRQRKDIEVHGTYHSKQPLDLQPGNDLHLKQINLSDQSQVSGLTAGIDVVVQCAAVTSGIKDVVQQPHIHVTDNVVMNSLLFRDCFENGVKHVIFLSCTNVYPNMDRPATEKDVTYELEDRYFGGGWMKVYMEKQCEFYSRTSPTKYTAIRHSNIYGPYDKFDAERSHVFGATISKVLTAKGGAVKVWGNGAEQRDLLYISDLIDFIEMIISNQEKSYEVVNIGYGKPISIADLVQKIITISGRNLSIEYDTSMPTVAFSLTLDIEKARTTFGWQPQVTLNEGIQKTIDWYLENVPH